MSSVWVHDPKRQNIWINDVYSWPDVAVHVLLPTGRTWYIIYPCLDCKDIYPTASAFIGFSPYTHSNAWPNNVHVCWSSGHQIHHSRTARRRFLESSEWTQRNPDLQRYILQQRLAPTMKCLHHMVLQQLDSFGKEHTIQVNTTPCCLHMPRVQAIAWLIAVCISNASRSLR